MHFTKSFSLPSHLTLRFLAKKLQVFVFLCVPVPYEIVNIKSWEVKKYIYSNTVLIYKFEVLVLYWNIVHFIPLYLFDNFSGILQL